MWWNNSHNSNIYYGNEIWFHCYHVVKSNLASVIGRPIEISETDTHIYLVILFQIMRVTSSPLRHENEILNDGHFRFRNECAWEVREIPKSTFIFTSHQPKWEEHCEPPVSLGIACRLLDALLWFAFITFGDMNATSQGCLC